MVPKTAIRAASALALMAALCGAPFASAGGPADTVAPHPDRKILKKVDPAYPELARERGVHGTVKIEIVIAANGTIKSTRAIGGHPVLIQAAEQALKSWKYEPGSEMKQTLEFKFGEQ